MRMKTRMSFFISEDERAALWRLAEHERRDPRDQVGLIVRAQLEKLGLLAPDLPTRREPEQISREPRTNRLAKRSEVAL